MNIKCCRGWGWGWSGGMGDSIHFHNGTMCKSSKLILGATCQQLSERRRPNDRDNHLAAILKCLVYDFQSKHACTCKSNIQNTCMYQLKHGSAVRAIIVRGVWSIETTLRVPYYCTYSTSLPCFIDLLYLASYLPCFLCRKRPKLSPLSCAVLYCARAST